MNLGIKQNIRNITNQGNKVITEKIEHYHKLFLANANAHDFENEYADLQLALTANPKFIFVDDSEDPNQAKPAIEKFLNEDLKDKIDFIIGINYIGGGLVIKLK